MTMGPLSEWARTARQYDVVLGQAGFYERGGFSQARAERLTSPDPISHTILAGPDDNVPAEMLTFSRAFVGA